MPTNERDPRVDPRPGDVLSDGDYTYEVQGRQGNSVWYKAIEDRTMPLGQWGMLRHGCTVVARGAEDNGCGED